MSALSDQQEVVELMIRRNPEILNTKNPDGNLPIHFTAQLYRRAFQDSLREKNPKFLNGSLFFFGFVERENILKMLIDRRPDQINLKNDGGSTILLLIVSSSGRLSFGDLDIQNFMHRKCLEIYFVLLLLFGKKAAESWQNI